MKTITLTNEQELVLRIILDNISCLDPNNIESLLCPVADQLVGLESNQYWEAMGFFNHSNFEFKRDSLKEFTNFVETVDFNNLKEIEEGN